MRLKRRSELVEQAWKDWSADFGPPTTEKIQWPSSIDGVNSRALLKQSQKQDPFCGAVVRQLLEQLDGATKLRTTELPMTPLLRPL